MYYSLCIKTGYDGNDDAEYKELFIEAPSEVNAWRIIIESNRISHDDIGVDRTAEMNIDGCYMIQLRDKDFREGIETGEYNGHKIECVNFFI